MFSELSVSTFSVTGTMSNRSLFMGLWIHFCSPPPHRCPFLLDRETQFYFKVYFYVKDYLCLSIGVHLCQSWVMCMPHSLLSRFEIFHTHERAWARGIDMWARTHAQPLTGRMTFSKLLSFPQPWFSFFSFSFF